MTLKEIADALIEACRTGSERQMLDDLYDPDALSVEPMDFGTGRVTEGLQGIHGKHDWWAETFETLEQTVSGPFLHGDDRFAVIFHVTARKRDSAEVIPMQEVAIYHVADGRIVREEFFATP